MKERNPIVAWLLICLILWVGVEIVHKVSVHQENPQQSVLATVGDRSITVADFEAYFYGMSLESQRAFSSSQGRRSMLFYRISEKLKPIVALNMGLGRDPLVISEIERRKRLRPSGDKTALADEVLVQFLFNRLYTTELAIRPTEIRRYFNYGREKYEHALFVETARLELPTTQEISRAEDLLSKGVAFEMVVLSMSHDPYAARNGGRMPPLFLTPGKINSMTKMLLFMRVGQVSPIVEENGGYVLYKLNAVRPVTLETMKPMIIQILGQAKIDEWMNKRWKDVPIQIDEKLLQALELRPPK